MDRNDYLEILHDYLEDRLSILEINNVLQKYEEIFIRNKLQGISDERTMHELGSPKYVADKEITDKKGETGKVSTSSSGVFEKRVLGLMRRIGSNILGKKDKHKKKNSILNEEAIISGRISEKKVKNIITATTVLAWIIGIPVILLLILLAVFLIGFSAANVIAGAGAFYLFSYRLSLGFFLMFVSITWAGVTILLWVIFIILLKSIIKIFINYTMWRSNKNNYLKIRNEYRNTDSSRFIDGMIIKDFNEDEMDDGGDDDEK